MNLNKFIAICLNLQFSFFFLNYILFFVLLQLHQSFLLAPLYAVPSP